MAKKRQTKKTKSTARGFWASDAGKKTFIGLLCVVAFAALFLVIRGFPERTGSQDGVGADGFQVYEMEGIDLGIVDVAKKETVAAELASLTKSIDDVQKSTVVNYNGNRAQTATYYLVTKDNARGSFYVDVMEFKDKKAYDDADVFVETADAGKIQGNEARYMRAATIANEREYALLVTKGTKSYKFAFTQAIDNVTIDEPTALAALKKIAEQSSL